MKKAVKYSTSCQASALSVEAATNNNNVESERIAVTGLVQYPELLLKVNIVPEDFYYKHYYFIYQAILQLMADGKEITEATIAIETVPRFISKKDAWLIKQVVEEMIDPALAEYEATVVKDLSKKRQLTALLNKISEEINTDKKAFENIDLDDYLAEVMSIRELDAPRLIRPTNVRKDNLIPPSYDIYIEIIGTDKGADIHFAEGELYSPKIVKDKITDTLGVRPNLPKDFDTWVNGIINNAKIEPVPKDATYKEQLYQACLVCLRQAPDAETYSDLQSGGRYIKCGYVGVTGKTLYDYLERKRKNVNNRDLWELLKNREVLSPTDENAPRVRIKGYKYTLNIWWFPLEQVELEDGEIIDENKGEQKLLIDVGKNDDDMSWL